MATITGLEFQHGNEIFITVLPTKAFPGTGSLTHFLITQKTPELQKKKNEHNLLGNIQKHEN